MCEFFFHNDAKYEVSENLEKVMIHTTPIPND